MDVGKLTGLSGIRRADVMDPGEDALVGELYAACVNVIQQIDPQFTPSQHPTRVIQLKTVSECLLIIAGVMNGTSTWDGVTVQDITGGDILAVRGINQLCARINVFLTDDTATSQHLRECTPGAVYPGCPLAAQYTNIVRILTTKPAIAALVGMHTR